MQPVRKARRCRSSRSPSGFHSSPAALPAESWLCLSKATGCWKIHVFSYRCRKHETPVSLICKIASNMMGPKGTEWRSESPLVTPKFSFHPCRWHSEGRLTTWPFAERSTLQVWSLLSLQQSIHALQKWWGKILCQSPESLFDHYFHVWKTVPCWGVGFCLQNQFLTIWDDL